MNLLKKIFYILSQPLQDWEEDQYGVKPLTKEANKNMRSRRPFKKIDTRNTQSGDYLSARHK